MGVKGYCKDVLRKTTWTYKEILRHRAIFVDWDVMSMYRQKQWAGMQHFWRKKYPFRIHSIFYLKWVALHIASLELYIPQWLL